MVALDELLQSWRADPDAETTITLCGYIGASNDHTLVAEVGEIAEELHSDDPDVMVAVGRMYLDGGDLAGSQRALMAAARVAKRNPRPFRYLGEVLLRQGEASRAKKALDHALSLGSASPAVSILQQHASEWVDLELTEGPEAVAERVATSLPRGKLKSSAPDAEEQVEELDSDSYQLFESRPPKGTQAVAERAPPSHVAPRRPAALAPSPVIPISKPFSPSAEESPLGEEDDDVTNVLSAASFRALVQRQPTRAKVAAPEPPAVSRTTTLDSIDLEPDATTAELFPNADSSFDEFDGVTQIVPNPSELRTLAVPQPRPPQALPTPAPPRSAPRPPVPPSPPPTSHPPVPHPAASQSARPPIESVDLDRVLLGTAPSMEGGAKPPPPPPSWPAPQRSPDWPLRDPLRPDPFPVSSTAKTELSKPLKSAPAPVAQSSGAQAQYAQTSPRKQSPAPLGEDSVIIDERTPRGDARAGTRTRAQTAPATPARMRARAETIPSRPRLPEPAARAPAKQRVKPKRRVWPSLFLLITLIGGALGAAGYGLWLDNQRRARGSRQHDEIDRIEMLLRSGASSDLALARRALRILGSDPRLAARASSLELRYDIVALLMSPSDAGDISSAIARARRLGVPKKAWAAASVAKDLQKHDLAHALETIRQSPAGSELDPYYRLATGATLEASGDPQALASYEAARQMAPDFGAAIVLHERMAVLFPAARGNAREETLGKLQPATAQRVLEALRAAADGGERDPGRLELGLSAEQRQALPEPLKPVVYLINARRAMVQGDSTRAAEEIHSGLEVTNSPFLTARLGALAFEIQSPELAERAAARLEALNPNDATARVLRARLALLNGKLLLAEQLMGELKGKASGDQLQEAIVRAIIAYEHWDSGSLRTALEPIDRRLREVSALSAASGILSGSALPRPEELGALIRPQVAWGEYIAFDAAIAAGDLKRAALLTQTWPARDTNALRLLRSARLTRYLGQPLTASQLSEQLFQGASPTPAVVVERVYALLAAKRAEQAQQLLSKYPEIGRPVLEWLEALVEMSVKRLPSDKTRKLAPPASDAPLPLRILAARTLAKARDPRADQYLARLAQIVPNHPDLRNAGID